MHRNIVTNEPLHAEIFSVSTGENCSKHPTHRRSIGYIHKKRRKLRLPPYMCSLTESTL